MAVSLGCCLGCRCWEAGSPCRVGSQRARGPALTPVIHENGESNVGRYLSGACPGTGNNKPFFSLALDSMCKSLVFPNQKWEDLSTALRLVWLHPLEGTGQRGRAALGPSPLRLGTWAAREPAVAEEVPSRARRGRRCCACTAQLRPEILPAALGKNRVVNSLWEVYSSWSFLMCLLLSHK